MHRLWLGILAAGGLSIASTAGAQAIDGRGNPYRQWDVAVGGTIDFDRERFGTRSGLYEVYDEGWQGGAAVQVDAGRYWSSHIKTEVSFAALTDHTGYGADPIPVPGGVATAPYTTHVGRTQLGAALTYQFFENVFAHPYVSAGVRATFYDRHTVRSPFAYLPYGSPIGATIQVPPFERRDRDVLARPYVAAGFKSYFNERTFIRSELSTAYADAAVSQWSVRLGFGVDF